MRGTKGEQEKNEKERTEYMEKILSQILNELKDFRAEMHDVKAEVRETKQEIREMKEENRKEHAEMKEDIAEIKEEQKTMKLQIAKNEKSIKEATDFIIDTTKSIARIVTDIRNDQQKQIRQLMLMEKVNFEKNKSQDEKLEKYHARIKQCEEVKLLKK